MQKTAKSSLFSYYLCTFAYSNEPLKQAGGSASSDLIIRRLQQDTDIRWFPVRNLENRVISQTSDKQDGLRILPKLRKYWVVAKKNAEKFAEAGKCDYLCGENSKTYETKESD